MVIYYTIKNVDRCLHFQLHDLVPLHLFVPSANQANCISDAGAEALAQVLRGDSQEQPGRQLAAGGGISRGSGIYGGRLKTLDLGQVSWSGIVGLADGFWPYWCSCGHLRFPIPSPWIVETFTRTYRTIDICNDAIEVQLKTVYGTERTRFHNRYTYLSLHWKVPGRLCD